MKYTSVLVLVAIAATASALARTPEGERQRPQKRTEVERVVSTSAPAVNLRAAVVGAKAIVVARVESASSVPAADARAPVQTDYQCLVTNVIKGDSVVTGQRIVVRRQGGVRDEGDVVRRVVVAGFPDFAVDEEYVFFLKTIEPLPVFFVSAEEAYEIKNGTITSLGRSHHARENDGVLVDTFIQRIRGAAEK